MDRRFWTPYLQIGVDSAFATFLSVSHTPRTDSLAIMGIPTTMAAWCRRPLGTIGNMAPMYACLSIPIPSHLWWCSPHCHDCKTMSIVPNGIHHRWFLHRMEYGIHEYTPGRCSHLHHSSPKRTACLSLLSDSDCPRASCFF